MIQCHLFNNNQNLNNIDNFEDIVKTININRKQFSEMNINAIIEILNILSKKILKDGTINKKEGITYISLWLRKENLQKVVDLNYQNRNFLNNFCDIYKNTKLYAQPRGIVCHWISGNMPTIGFFSLILGLLSRNGNILKMPKENAHIIIAILNNLKGIEFELGGVIFKGEDILKNIAIVSFESKNQDLTKKFSLIADCKIIWGGKDAVSSITSLPQKEHCEIITFGPKYSFSVFDKEFIENNLDDCFLKMAIDVVLFNQMACSSPHVIFVEKNKFNLHMIAEKLQFAFENIPDKLFNPLPQRIVSEIINQRSIYLLEDNKSLIKSKGLKYSIFINHELSLEEPIQGRCIHLKEVDDIFDIVPLVTRKIQAISVGINDNRKKEKFSKLVSYNGVDRITVPGKIHDFDIVWDGMMYLNRLVRWILIRE